MPSGLSTEVRYLFLQTLARTPPARLDVCFRGNYIVSMETKQSPAVLESHLGYWLRFVSKSVDRLEKRGLAERKPLPQDGRAQILKLTAKGARLVPVLAALADRNDAE